MEIVFDTIFDLNQPPQAGNAVVWFGSRTQLVLRSVARVFGIATAYDSAHVVNLNFLGDIILGDIMYLYSEAVAPAVCDHLDAQISFVSNLSNSMFRSFEQLCKLNLRTMRALMEESTQRHHPFAIADWKNHGIGAAAARFQPANDQLRAYFRDVACIAADAQVELVHVAEQHAGRATRAAHTLADEVARETKRGVRTQQDTISNFSETFMQAAVEETGSEHAGAVRKNTSEDEPGNVEGTVASASNSPLVIV